MKKRRVLKKSALQSGLCLLLSAVTVLTLVLPGVDMQRAEPADPLAMQTIEEIEVLNVGENISQMNTIVVPSGGSAPPTEPIEESPEETDPEQTEPNETIPEETQSEEPDIGEGEEGNEEGNQGEEGGQELQLDLAVVMTWAKHGKETKSIVCAPSKAVAKTLNTAQLKDNVLKYSFHLKGDDAKYVNITSVTMEEGDSPARAVEEDGEVQIQLPGGTGKRNYTFRIQALAEKRNDAGQMVSQELDFAFVIRCEYAMDLEMDLNWENKDGRVRTITCGPDRAEALSVKNHELHERVFVYTVDLTGSLAEDAQIVDASYTTASGHRSGTIEKNGGSLILDPAPGYDSETYYLTFSVKVQDRTVLYTYNVVYQEMLDVKLSFTWRDRGMIRHDLICMPGGSVSDRIKNNQLSAGTIAITAELLGDDAADGRIMTISYTSETGSGVLESDTLPITMSEGATSNTYHLVVDAMVKGQKMKFEIVLHYANDVMLQMSYTVQEDGMNNTRVVACENNKSKMAENVYDDQLAGNLLQYEMEIVGNDGEDVRITEVSCYQTGTGRSTSLSDSGMVELKMDEGKTGDNAFAIKAQDDSGNEYSFEINIPYKHRGENTIEIQTNLEDGQRIPNAVKTNLTVKAVSKDAAGNTLDYILANGTETKLIVKLDGEELRYISSSGASSEYDLFPSNPEEGDTNEHILEIYAEDALGNFGQRQLTLIGERKAPGHQIGTATIKVDMTVLGLGVVDSVSYDVLADEPISYVIAKAVLGEVLEEPFGQAKQTFGWTGNYEGTLDRGFYLASITTGHTANALEGSTWPGSTEEEILAAIDDRFGKGTKLATLWRCLYRNGLDKSSGSGGTFSEFDYTSGSGWMYSVGGSTYYPGQSMSAVYLQDGDVLTLRFTLAQGWDVGGGNPGYSSTVGYCVSAINGDLEVNHQMETATDENGKEIYVCHCCGLEESCRHSDLRCEDEGNGTHVQYCNECNMTVGDWEEHRWGAPSVNDSHVCIDCGAQARHYWIETNNTAECDAEGELWAYCDICLEEKVDTAPAKGHIYDDRWYSTDDNSQHYQQCSRCGEEHAFLDHRYTYDSGWGDFQCDDCGMFHGIYDIDCPGELLPQSDSDRQRMHYVCSYCGCDFVEYHEYEGGYCLHCGGEDPDYIPDEDPPAEHIHSWGGRIVEYDPECEYDGLAYYICGECGEEEYEDIPALGHAYNGVYCERCGAEDPDYMPP